MIHIMRLHVPAFQLTQTQKNSIIGVLRIDFLSILVQRNGGAASHLR